MMNKKRSEPNKGRILKISLNKNAFDSIEKEKHIWKNSASFCVMPPIGMHGPKYMRNVAWKKIFHITADVQSVCVSVFKKTYHASCEPSIGRVLPWYIHSNRSEHHRYLLRVNWMLLLLFFYSIGFYELNMCVIYAARTCQCWWQIRYIHPSIHCWALQTHELNVYNNHLKREDEEKSARTVCYSSEERFN